MTESASSAAAQQILFGPFRLIRAQHVLLLDGKPVRVGGRALAILLTLLERPGEIVSKDELVARVWPRVFVDEANLRVHIGALRKALGDGQGGARYISTIPGRGYCFVAEVIRSAAPALAAESDVAAGAAAVHAPESRIVGRSEVVRTLAAQLPAHRFTTLVGPGGIGKTTLALAVADAIGGTLRDGVRFVELARLTDPSLVATALASALGLAVRSESPVRNIASFLRDKQMLIVLDNCEHVVDAAAALAESALRDAAGVLVLATSREPLGVAGERLHRVTPLAWPTASKELTAAEAMRFPAVQLFVERAAARLDSYDLTDADAPFVASICRRLDGIALAIEIAAGRVDAFGVAGLATLLDDRFRLLMRGDRTALPRHQTLGAALDWSYALLPELERVVLRRLAIFAGVFTVESVCAVLESEATPAADIVGLLVGLINKSLVAANVTGMTAQYRLLDTTRAYAHLKLLENREDQELARRHGEHFRDLLQRAAIAWARQPAAEWMEAYAHAIDNVRAALDWSFSPAGDSAVAIKLTLGAVPLWFHASLLNECYERVQLALSRLPPGADGQDEMRLSAALGWSLMQTKGSVAETRRAWSRVLALAEELGDLDHEGRALWGLWAGSLNNGDLRRALALAERFCAIAPRQTDPGDRFVGDRMIGYTLHLMGRQTDARRCIERMLAGYSPGLTGAQVIRFVFDQRMTARCFLARILWLQGFPDQAMAMVADIIGGALASGDTLSLCQALVQGACPVALLVGDLVVAERYVEMLVDASSANALDFWQAWGGCFNGVLRVRRGEVASGLRLLERALEELRNIEFGVYYVSFMCDFSDALGQAGEPGRGLQAIAEALERAERNDERWCYPEVLRIKADLLLQAGAPSAAADAAACLTRSLAAAREQETPSWSLRSAVSLARLWHSQGRTPQARELLGEAIGQFTEGFDTLDMQAARAQFAALAARQTP